VAPVRQWLDRLLQIMKAGPDIPFSRRYDTLMPVIDRVFDLDAILRSSRACRGPPRHQTSRISCDRRSVATPPHPASTVLTILMVSFNVAPQLRPAGNGEQIVVTQITPRSGDSHETDYVMRNIPSGWRGGRPGGRSGQSRRGAALGFSSFAVPRWRADAGEQPSQQVTPLVWRHELKGR